MVHIAQDKQDRERLISGSEIKLKLRKKKVMPILGGVRTNPLFERLFTVAFLRNHPKNAQLIVFAKPPILRRQRMDPAMFH